MKDLEPQLPVRHQFHVIPDWELYHIDSPNCYCCPVLHNPIESLLDDEEELWVHHCREEGN